VFRDVYVGGEEGYNTYRIPAMVVTTDGTLLAFCEGRKLNSLDHGDIDLVLRRSPDGGDTWGPQQLVWEDGNHTIGNPAPVVDRETGTVLLAFTRDNLQVFVTRSEDDGATWSVPEDITRQVKPPGWGWYATGPGHGIQLAGGRLLVACDHRVWFTTYSHVIYSDDHGRTWALGGSADPGTDESLAVELADGSLYLTMRNSLFRNQRARALSTDAGLNWSPAQAEPALVDPLCQASILRLTSRAVQGRNRVLFANPASTKRERMTVRVSYDEAETWPLARVLYEGKAAYSDMAAWSDTAFGVLYENGVEMLYQRITFARLTLAWIE
jgi:sialidase-1